MTYTEEQMVEMTLEIDAIVELINAVADILDEEKKNPPQPSEGNVYHTDFFILTEFYRLRDAKLKLPQVLAVYHDWAERTYNLASSNRGKLRKGKLREHVEKCLSQIQTIHALFTQSPPPSVTKN